MTQPKNYLLLGVGGIGMSALALMLREKGASVSGIDHTPSHYLDKLKKEGVRIYDWEGEIDWTGVSEVVATSALDEMSPLFREAARRGITVVRRGEMLAGFLNDAPIPVAVTGTHGKTTTTALLAHLFIHGGYGTRMYLGGISKNYDTNYLRTGDEYFISEVDESDRTIEKMAPKMALITNIEYEHVDRYRDFEDLLSTFRVFFSRMREGGKVFFGEGSSVVPSLVGGARLQTVMISKKGSSSKAPVQCTWDREHLRGKVSVQDRWHFEVRYAPLYGWHNVENAAFVVACAWEAGMSAEAIQTGLDTFRGVKRRFETLLTAGSGVRFITDYAHHPTEIRRVLALAREVARDKKICVVFQPHRITRLRYFIDEFADSLRTADIVYVTEVFTAGESGDPVTLSRELVGKLEGFGREVSFIMLKDLDEVLRTAAKQAEMVIFLGAGSIDDAAREIVKNYA